MNGNPKKQKIIILGDFNSQIGKTDREKDDYELFGNCIGHEKSNENGECMKMFLKIHRIRISSMNQNKISMTTWSNGSAESQIDHVVTDSTSDFIIKFIRAKLTSIRTDHKLIIMGLSLEKKTGR